jgi:hypothetical protein
VIGGLQVTHLFALDHEGFVKLGADPERRGLFEKGQVGNGGACVVASFDRFVGRGFSEDRSTLRSIGS